MFQNPDISGYCSPTRSLTLTRVADFGPLWDEGILPAGIHRTLSSALADHAFPDLFALDPDSLLPSITSETVDKKDLAYSIAMLDAGLLVRMGSVPGESIWEKWYADDTPGSEDWTVEAVRKDLLAAIALRPFEIPRILSTLGPKNWIYRELSRAYPEAKKSILTYSGLPQIPDPSSAGVAKPGGSMLLRSLHCCPPDRSRLPANGCCDDTNPRQHDAGIECWANCISERLRTGSRWRIRPRFVALPEYECSRSVSLHCH